jgi:hypothetical protein
MRFVFLPDNDVFYQVRPGRRLRVRADPSFTMSCRRTTKIRRILVFPIAGWWSQTGSNRRPHACKARALPTELWPRLVGELSESCRSNRCSSKELVGPGRLELPTSRLSGVRSNQLSYGPMAAQRPLTQVPRNLASPLGSRSRRESSRTPRMGSRPATNGKRNEDGGALHL